MKMKMIPMSKAARVPSGSHPHSRMVGATLTVVLILCVVVTTLVTALVSAQTRASGSYKVILTTANFSQSLQATAADLSDPASVVSKASGSNIRR